MQQVAIGSILEGKVTGITKFGAFVEIAEGTTGMVHISEVAHDYVKEISEHLKLYQQVKVKVLSISDDGKISLSIKKAETPQQNNYYRPSPPPRPSYNKNSNQGSRNSNDNMSFEDMMSKFKQSSEAKMYDLKKNMDVKRGTSGKRGGSNNRP